MPYIPKTALAAVNQNPDSGVKPGEIIAAMGKLFADPDPAFIKKLYDNPPTDLKGFWQKEFGITLGGSVTEYFKNHLPKYKKLVEGSKIHHPDYKPGIEFAKSVNGIIANLGVSINTREELNNAIKELKFYSLNNAQAIKFATDGKTGEGAVKGLIESCKITSTTKEQIQAELPGKLRDMLDDKLKEVEKQKLLEAERKQAEALKEKKQKNDKDINSGIELAKKITDHNAIIVAFDKQYDKKSDLQEAINKLKDKMISTADIVNDVVKGLSAKVVTKHVWAGFNNWLKDSGLENHVYDNNTKEEYSKKLTNKINTKTLDSLNQQLADMEYKEGVELAGPLVEHKKKIQELLEKNSIPPTKLPEINSAIAELEKHIEETKSRVNATVKELDSASIATTDGFNSVGTVKYAKGEDVTAALTKEVNGGAEELLANLILKRDELEAKAKSDANAGSDFAAEVNKYVKDLKEFDGKVANIGALSSTQVDELLVELKNLDAKTKELNSATGMLSNPDTNDGFKKASDVSLMTVKSAAVDPPSVMQEALGKDLNSLTTKPLEKIKEELEQHRGKLDTAAKQIRNDKEAQGAAIAGEVEEHVKKLNRFNASFSGKDIKTSDITYVEMKLTELATLAAETEILKTKAAGILGSRDTVINDKFREVAGGEAAVTKDFAAVEANDGDIVEKLDGDLDALMGSFPDIKKQLDERVDQIEKQHSEAMQAATALAAEIRELGFEITNESLAGKTDEDLKQVVENFNKKIDTAIGHITAPWTDDAEAKKEFLSELGKSGTKEAKQLNLSNLSGDSTQKELQGGVKTELEELRNGLIDKFKKIQAYRTRKAAKAEAERQAAAQAEAARLAKEAEDKAKPAGADAAQPVLERKKSVETDAEIFVNKSKEILDKQTKPLTVDEMRTQIAEIEKMKEEIKTKVVTIKQVTTEAVNDSCETIIAAKDGVTEKAYIDKLNTDGDLKAFNDTRSEAWATAIDNDDFKPGLATAVNSKAVTKLKTLDKDLAARLEVLNQTLQAKVTEEENAAKALAAQKKAEAESKTKGIEFAREVMAHARKVDALNPDPSKLTTADAVAKQQAEVAALKQANESLLLAITGPDANARKLSDIHARQAFQGEVLASHKAAADVAAEHGLEINNLLANVNKSTVENVNPAAIADIEARGKKLNDLETSLIAQAELITQRDLEMRDITAAADIGKTLAGEAIGYAADFTAKSDVELDEFETVAECDAKIQELQEFQKENQEVKERIIEMLGSEELSNVNVHNAFNAEIIAAKTRGDIGPEVFANISTKPETLAAELGAIEHKVDSVIEQLNAHKQKLEANDFASKMQSFNATVTDTALGGDADAPAAFVGHAMQAAQNKDVSALLGNTTLESEAEANNVDTFAFLEKYITQQKQLHNTIFDNGEPKTKDDDKTHFKPEAVKAFLAERAKLDYTPVAGEDEATTNKNINAAADKLLQDYAGRGEAGRKELQLQMKTAAFYCDVNVYPQPAAMNGSNGYTITKGESKDPDVKIEVGKLENTKFSMTISHKNDKSDAAIMLALDTAWINAKTNGIQNPAITIKQKDLEYSIRWLMHAKAMGFQASLGKNDKDEDPITEAINATKAEIAKEGISSEQKQVAEEKLVVQQKLQQKLEYIQNPKTTSEMLKGEIAKQVATDAAAKDEQHKKAINKGP